MATPATESAASAAGYRCGSARRPASRDDEEREQRPHQDQIPGLDVEPRVGRERVEGWERHEHGDERAEPRPPGDERPDDRRRAGPRTGRRRRTAPPTHSSVNGKRAPSAVGSVAARRLWMLSARDPPRGGVSSEYQSCLTFETSHGKRSDEGGGDHEPRGSKQLPPSPDEPRDRWESDHEDLRGGPPAEPERETEQQQLPPCRPLVETKRREARRPGRGRAPPHRSRAPASTSRRRTRTRPRRRQRRDERMVRRPF